MRAALLLIGAMIAAGACASADDTASDDAASSAGGMGPIGAGPVGPTGTGSGGDEPTCTAAQPATIADRAILGRASPYPADGTLRGQEAELTASPEARRRVAWAAVERILAPIAIEASLPNAPGATLPRFRTWYAKDDLTRLFHHLYGNLGAARRAAQDPFTASELDDAFGWNPDAVLDDPAWPADRFDDYVASLDTEEELGALAGVTRVGYSPGAARHFLASYGPIVACDGQAPPAAVTDAPSAGPRRLAHHAATLSACERRSWGPYFVGEGEQLVATVTGDASLVLVDDTGNTQCEGAIGAACEAEGPRAVHVVAAARRGGDVTVDVDYREANPEWASCLDGPFPLDAALVKTDWRRVWPGDPLPTYDTSPAAIDDRREGEASWDEPDGEAEPGPDAVYTVTTPAGSTFRLAGLHVMTKELDHWLWITLWWSPDPDGALGADRPASLTGPWRHYQMAVVTSFSEADGSPTWCSNPYLEQGPGNAATNCIGCHQHGGTGLTSEAILANLPAHGSTALRNNFPADYSWALDGGDQLLRLFADEVAWWAAGE